MINIFRYIKFRNKLLASTSGKREKFSKFIDQNTLRKTIKDVAWLVAKNKFEDVTMTFKPRIISSPSKKRTIVYGELHGVIVLDSKKDILVNYSIQSIVGKSYTMDSNVTKGGKRVFLSKGTVVNCFDVICALKNSL